MGLYRIHIKLFIFVYQSFHRPKIEHNWLDGLNAGDQLKVYRCMKLRTEFELVAGSSFDKWKQEYLFRASQELNHKINWAKLGKKLFKSLKVDTAYYVGRERFDIRDVGVFKNKENWNTQQIPFKYNPPMTVKGFDSIIDQATKQLNTENVPTPILIIKNKFLPKSNSRCNMSEFSFHMPVKNKAYILKNNIELVRPQFDFYHYYGTGQAIKERMRVFLKSIEILSAGELLKTTRLMTTMIEFMFMKGNFTDHWRREFRKVAADEVGYELKKLKATKKLLTKLRSESAMLKSCQYEIPSLDMLNNPDLWEPIKEGRLVNRTYIHNWNLDNLIKHNTSNLKGITAPDLFMKVRHSVLNNMIFEEA